MIENLNRDQTFALISEMNSTRNLLAYGIRAMRTAAFVETTRDPIFTMLSIGVEKLYKLTLGLVDLEREGKWPSKAQMKSHGHNLIEMHDAVFDELRKRTADKTAYVRDLFTSVEEDFVVKPLIAALGRYGQSGRFYYLDVLGDSPQVWESPEEHWQRIEDAVMLEPAINALFNEAMKSISNNELWESFHDSVHERIALAIERLWEMVAVSARNRALGVAGTQFGFEVHPRSVGRQ
ncbi:hypothetical protein [Glutamicibacter sp.]|uniref:hypothetical protein n=1 Tax=Glutamicibacter sp. TaxID=1931995 RepID=UPI002FE0D64D